VPWPSEPLTDGVAALRPLTSGDLPAFSVAARDENVQRMAGWPHPFTETDAHRWLEDHDALYEAGLALDLAIIEADSGGFAGIIQLHRLEWATRRASVGLWLAPEARGRGLMTHSLRLLLKWIFREGVLDRIEYLTRADNTPSIELALRCGLLREGLLRSCLVSGRQRHDAVLLAALRGEWDGVAPTTTGAMP
jgi:[ribosomal protein S5]-alanine N-acetyltransferase